MEFTETHDLVKTFEKFEINFDQVLPKPSPAPKRSSRSNSVVSSSTQHKLQTSAPVAPVAPAAPAAPVAPVAPAPSKYVETLLNWKSREEENPHIIIPQVVIKRPPSSVASRPTSPQPSDWLKALSGGAFEPSEKRNRQPLFIQIEKNTTPLHHH